jgi:hypothetical protein
MIDKSLSFLEQQNDKIIGIRVDDLLVVHRLLNQIYYYSINTQNKNTLIEFCVN